MEDGILNKVVTKNNHFCSSSKCDCWCCYL